MSENGELTTKAIMKTTCAQSTPMGIKKTGKRNLELPDADALMNVPEGHEVLITSASAIPL
jgi:hypothetical protein